MARISDQYSKKTARIDIFSKPILVKALVILGVIGLTGLIGFAIGKPNSRNALILAAIPLGIVGFAVLLKFLNQSPVLIILVAAFVPFSLSTGTESKVVASLIITVVFVGVWFLRMAGIEKRIHLIPSPINAPLLSFIAATVCSLGWSNIFRDPLVRVTSTFPFVQMASTLVMVMLPLSLLLVGNRVRDVKVVKWMVVVILVVGGLDLVTHFVGLNLPINANGITQMWVISFSLALVFYHTGLSGKQKVGLTVLALASIIWGFGFHIDWLAGWLPGLVAVGVIVFFRSKKYFFILLCAVLVIYLVDTNYILKDISSETTTSGETRVAAWMMNWRVTSEHLLFGTGPAGYAAYYMTYFPSEAMATHSNYIDIVSETGVIGFGFFLWLFIAIARFGYTLLRRLKGRGDFLEAVTIGVFAGTIGCIVIMGFGDWLIPFAYTQTIAGFNYEVYSWLFLGTLIVIDQLTKPENDLIAAIVAHSQEDLA